MENNYLVGDILHKKKINKEQYKEKQVLYNIDNNKYLDLLNDKIYTTNTKEKTYVIKESLEKIDIRDLKEDYNYLLIRHKEKPKKKKLFKF